MVNAFSSYAQPVSMQLGEVNLNQLIQDVVELHKREDRPIAISYDLDESLPELSADNGRLRQVLNNLLINATDALSSNEHPEIRISTQGYKEHEQRFVELIVRDNGPGIPEDMLERLFEPYVTTKDRGTGLGLAIVKRVIEEHGGTVWASNIEPSGTRITVRLPISAQREQNTADFKVKPLRARVAGSKGA
jgi:nitrogen fixation/metabolism regulation signal transduction histidine kinase